MKTALTLLTGLVLASLLLPARAQTAPTVQPKTGNRAVLPNPKTAGAAGRKHTAYSGPYVVGDSKALGQKFIQQSRPTDGPVRLKDLPSPK